MTTIQKILLIIGAVVIVGAVALVTLNGKNTNTVSEDTGVATSTPEDTPAVPDVKPVTENTSTTTQETPALLDMEPIIPEAKVSTEGWKTCRNEEYGYEFKFPGEWHIYGEDALSEQDLRGKRIYVRESEECNGESIHLAPISPDKLDSCSSQSDCISITLHAMVIPTTPELYWNNMFASETATNYRQRTPILIDSITGMLSLTTNIFGYWQVVVINSDKVYTVSGFQYDANQTTIETIVSTFRLFDASFAVSQT